MRMNALQRLKSHFEDIFRDRTRLVRLSFIFFILILALAVRLHENSKTDITVETSAETASSVDVCVDIGGAVVDPGVYTVSSGTRLYEVIDMAGGLLSDADTDMINRAEFVEDGEKIMIPFRNDTDTEDTVNVQEDETDTGSSGQTHEHGLININYASREELMTLKGIGEAKADKIIEYRSKSKFRTIEDIKNVEGIGESIFSGIKGFITV